MERLDDLGEGVRVSSVVAVLISQRPLRDFAIAVYTSNAYGCDGHRHNYNIIIIIHTYGRNIFYIINTMYECPEKKKITCQLYY